MNRYLWADTVWIAVSTAIYAFVYMLTPLGDYGIFWMSFVAIPIYFNAGAKPEELPNYLASALAGVLWAVPFLWFLNFCIAQGASMALAFFLDLLILTIPCVGLHLTFFSNSLFNKVPMIFGGLSMMFSQGGENVIPIAITLAGGLCLAALYTIGGNWLHTKIIGGD